MTDPTISQDAPSLSKKAQTVAKAIGYDDDAWVTHIVGKVLAHLRTPASSDSFLGGMSDEDYADFRTAAVRSNPGTPASGEAGEMVERLRAHANANPQTPWRAKTELEAVDLITRLSATDTEAMRQIAADLIDQRDEPDMFGLSYDRVHYWRDKAINAAARIDALAKGRA